MNHIIEDVALATDLPQAAGTQEDNQSGDSPVSATDEKWETPSHEETTAIKWHGKPVTVIDTTPAEAAKLRLQTGMVPVALLRSYARNGEIYEDRDDPLFTENIRKNGVLTDLVVNEDGEVLGGNRRLREAKRVGLKEVPVKVVTCNTEDEKTLRVLDDNVQRVKSKVEIAREYVERLKVETRAAALRKVEAGRKTKEQMDEVKTLTPPLDKKGKARDKAAKELDLSGVTAEKGRKVLEAMAKARAQGAAEVAEDLLVRLNDEGFHSAFKRAQALKLIVPAVKKNAKTKAVITPKVTAHAAPQAEAEAVAAVPAADEEAAATVANDEDGDDAVVAAYIGAAAKLAEVMAENLTFDQRKNLLRAHDDAQDWFAYNAAVLNEKR